MNRFGRYISFIILALVIFSIGSFAIGDTATSYSTANDPLVSLSYVNTLKEQIVNELYEKADADALADYLKSTSFSVETLSQGQQIIATGSCELVLRSGKGTIVITSQENVAVGTGFSDLTAGVEVTNGMSVPKNHILLASRGDGRMITVTSSTAFIMARGDYSIVG